MHLSRLSLCIYVLIFFLSAEFHLRMEQESNYQILTQGTDSDKRREYTDIIAKKYKAK